VYHSTLGVRVKKKKKVWVGARDEEMGVGRRSGNWGGHVTPHPREGRGVGVQGLGIRVQGVGVERERGGAP